MPPVVTVFVHAIDTTVHRSVPPGWRWAVHVGGRPAHDLAGCVNASWEPDERNACIAGEQVGAAVVKALAMCGLQPTCQVFRLAADPIPADHDRISI